MKKIVITALLIFFFTICSTSALAEDTVPKVLKESIINIISDGEGGYDINQQILLSGEGNLGGDRIEHIFSKIENIEPENLQFLHNETELNFTTEEAGTLVRYYVEIPEGISDSFEYEAQYSTSVDENVFTTPLFVPAHSASGQENVVTINFETTPENIVQRNSFPVLKKAEDSQVTSYLMNIPSHVNYIYGPERNVLNTFNLVSWGSILILLGIIAIWIRSEVKSNNLKGVKE